MQFLQALENSAFIDWFLTSLWGFPVFIAVHSIGMAFVVGLSLIVAIRYIGYLSDVSLEIVGKLIRLAWLGFAVNFVTGFILLLSRITQYLFDTTFPVKIVLIIIAAIGLRLMQVDFRFSQKSLRLKRRYLPYLTVLGWIGALTAGRWIAYLSGIYA
ncbi:MAG: hypothetical protein KTR16_04575 [Acidiferrobacterales bacterium]|nr:hypothetical protein [Acidiferrobacterales bacterium]